MFRGNLLDAAVLTPEYLELADELARLAARVSGEDSFVFDAWGLVWSVSRFPGIALRERMLAQVRHVLEELATPLASGGTIDHAYHELTPALYCRSFVRIYVVGVWIPAPADELTTRAGVRLALPTIEALTLTLPRPPGRGSFPQASSRRP